MWRAFCYCMLGLSACSFLTLTYVTLYSERKKLLIIWQDKLLNDLGHGLHCLWLWTYFLKALSLITATFSPGEPQACPGLLSAHTFWLFIYQIQYWGGFFFFPFANASMLVRLILSPVLCSQQGCVQGLSLVQGRQLAKGSWGGGKAA